MEEQRQDIRCARLGSPHFGQGDPLGLQLFPPPHPTGCHLDTGVDSDKPKHTTPEALGHRDRSTSMGFCLCHANI